MPCLTRLYPPISLQVRHYLTLNVIREITGEVSSGVRERGGRVGEHSLHLLQGETTILEEGEVAALNEPSCVAVGHWSFGNVSSEVPTWEYTYMGNTWQIMYTYLYISTIMCHVRNTCMYAYNVHVHVVCHPCSLSVHTSIWKGTNTASTTYMYSVHTCTYHLWSWTSVGRYSIYYHAIIDSFKYCNYH